MRILKKFEEYLEEGVMIHITPDVERSRSLQREAIRKMNSLNEKLDKIKIKTQNSNDYVEHCYDIIMFLIRSKLYKMGFSSSGKGAHEAEVAYTRNIVL